MKSIAIGTFLVVLLALTGCDKKEEVYPIEEIKIKNIKTPAIININGIQYGYSTLHVAYNGEEIAYITNRYEFGGKSELRDSTRFYYINGKLDNAIRTENSYDMFNKPTSNQLKYVFIWNSADKIISVTAKSQKFNSSDFLVNYSYKGSNLIAIRSSYTYKNDDMIDVSSTRQIDSVFYTPEGKISSKIGYYLQNSGGSIKSKHEFLNFKNHYNPYFLINKRLGFPFLSSHASSRGEYLPVELPQHNPGALSVTQYDQQWTTDGPKILSQGKVDLLYEVDKKGRATSQYTEGNHNMRTIFEYY